MKKVITYIITIIAISSLLRGNQANSQQQTSYLENVKTLNSLISYQEYQKAADFLEVLSIDSENEQIQEHGIALSRTIDIAPISDSAPISSIILALTPYTLPLLYGITVPKKYIPKIWATSALIFLEAAFLATTRSVIAEWSINSKLISRYLKTAPKEIILNIQKKKWTIFTLYTLFHTLKHKQDDPGVLSFFVDIQKTLYNSISYNTLMTLLRMFSKYKMTELQEYILNSARSAHNLEIINFHKNNIVKKIAKALFYHWTIYSIHC